ncbi:MOSC domain-containing protein [Corynebacterium endometrii]|uniref:6-N-hydroxylaminopurine resistance protein n=1 Tax=Corynebacterium endometrii TaxID=2488819 RepID=A0A4P7QIY7_9CORY|nr:MOSC domain-containing protein [Corynebacterium endometrii]QCB29460.1 6-N-hydroxylaminopurine resistance protein [Corynebacterium endometrii]
MKRIARVISTNVAAPLADPGGAGRKSGIDKRPEPCITVFRPGPNYGDGSGVEGDFIGDTKWHGGEHKAVYGFAREELNYWEGRLGRGLADGSFGENLTTEGVVWKDALIGQRFRVGEAMLEVSIPRTPCRTFAGWLGERGWLKMFSERGDAGSYFRVIEGGTIAAGDEITFEGSPKHDVTMGMAYRAKMGDLELARHIVKVGCLPEVHQVQLIEMLDKRG